VLESDIDWSVRPGQPRRIHPGASPYSPSAYGPFPSPPSASSARVGRGAGGGGSRGGSRGSGGGSGRTVAAPCLPSGNAAVAAMLTLHGEEAASVAQAWPPPRSEVARFAQRAMYPDWTHPDALEEQLRALGIGGGSGGGGLQAPPTPPTKNYSSPTPLSPPLSPPITGSPSSSSSSEAAALLVASSPSSPSPLLVRSRAPSFGGHARAASLVANSQSMIRPVERVTARGWEMFRSRAYVHQYAKWGIEDDDFTMAFSQLEEVIHRYRGLT
jgi:hypothetical protein